MSIRTLRFVAILLAALAMGMKLAHALELGPKLGFGPELYLVVQMTLYRVFGLIGPILEVGALLCVATLAWRLRGSPAFAPTAVSAAAIAASLAVFAVFVRPANAQIAAWAETGVTPADWTHWRNQWQFAQTTSFALHLVGFCALLRSVLRETPADRAK